MLLAPDMGYADTHAEMSRIYFNLQNDEYLQNKEYFYSISFGAVAVEKDCGLSSSNILSIADERMYENKKARKMNRQQGIMR